MAARWGVPPAHPAAEVSGVPGRKCWSLQCFWGRQKDFVDTEMKLGRDMRSATAIVGYAGGRENGKCGHLPPARVPPHPHSCTWTPNLCTSVAGLVAEGSRTHSVKQARGRARQHDVSRSRAAGVACPTAFAPATCRTTCYYYNAPGTTYEAQGHAEVVQVGLDDVKAEEQMAAFAETYFSQFQKGRGGMIRQARIVTAQA